MGNTHKKQTELKISPCHIVCGRYREGGYLSRKHKALKCTVTANNCSLSRWRGWLAEHTGFLNRGNHGKRQCSHLEVIIFAFFLHFSAHSLLSPMSGETIIQINFNLFRCPFTFVVSWRMFSNTSQYFSNHPLRSCPSWCFTPPSPT